MKNPKATENGKRVASSLERAGCASGSHDLTILRYKERQLSMCDQMLTDAGVPEWVMASDSNGVPANSVPSRLKWYLARRKDVAAGEIDQGLQDDMKEMLRLARQRHNAGAQPPPG